MNVVLRIIVFLAVLAVSVNHGVEAGTNSNPGWGVVWGILFFVFWLIVVNIMLTLVMNGFAKLNSYMDDHTY